MIFFGGRLSLNSIPKILIFLVALYEFCIILRVVVRIVLSITKMPEGRVSDILYRITEPVLYPVRTAIRPALGGLPVDLSPAVAVLLCELLQWLMRLVFRI